MSQGLLFLLCFVGLNFVDGRLYKNAKLSIFVVQNTSNCVGAGTDADVTIKFGYTGPNNSLLYSIKTPAQKGTGLGRFERGTTLNFTHDVPEMEFAQVERACAELAMSSSGFDQSAYDQCFNVNLIYFETYTWPGNFGDAWKPGKTVATFSFTLSDGSVQKRVAEFTPKGDCTADWVKGGSHHYMCSGGMSQGSEYLPRGQRLDRRTVYPCYTK
uniref:Hyalin n=1 Tax=Steinernema glaseri TaxID=37863 RepID=A0A1I7ZG34_9BILA